MPIYLALWLAACGQPATSTPGTGDRLEIISTHDAPADLCPGASPYQVLYCTADYAGSGSTMCLDMSADLPLVDGCLCIQLDGAEFVCDLQPPEDVEYRLSWWE